MKHISPLEWKVYFDGNFHGHLGHDHAGTEIPVNKHFQWADEHWLIPSIYSCGKGLVVDIFRMVSAETIQTFIDKWNLSAESIDTDFTQEQQELIHAENPLEIDLKPEVKLNKKTLRDYCGYGLSWNPCVKDFNDMEARNALIHYNLDDSCGWVIRRYSIPWNTKRRPQIKSLQIILDTFPVSIPGPHFKVLAVDDTFTFMHPTTGITHTLTVTELEKQELNLEHINTEQMIYPNLGLAMNYTLSPDLDNSQYYITDCARSDQPQKIELHNKSKSAANTTNNIIGGADGPTSIFFAGKGRKHTHAACSSLHFNPVTEVEWRIVFQEKQRERIEVDVFI